jgi:TolB-like protein/tetratricopeptide (TPR) repeat protein
LLPPFYLIRLASLRYDWFVARSDSRPTYRFGEYELDVGVYQLRRRQRRIPLERRAMDLLILLVENHPNVVTRSDIVHRLWAPDVFVDALTGVNTVVYKVRQALRDKPVAPIFIETIPGKGYRFVSDVEVVHLAEEEARARTTVAVLPFENLDSDASRDYIATGLTEEAIAVLGEIAPGYVSVIGRTSVLTYRGTTRTLAEIGHELHADYLVEGSTRSDGVTLRITCKLIRAADQRQVWAASFDRNLVNILEMQRGLGRAIAEQVRLRLSPRGLGELDGRQIGHLDTYNLYLRGRNLWNQRTEAATRRASEYFRRALTLDPDDALAWSGLTDAYAVSPLIADASSLSVWPHARDAAAHAVEANPELAEAQASLGMVRAYLDWDWPAAETAYRQAIALNPDYAFAHTLLGILLSHRWVHNEAQAAARRGCELAPLWAMTHAMSAQVAFHARDYPAAVEHARRTIAIDPEFWVGYMQLGQAYEQMDLLDRALESLNMAARFSGGNSKTLALRSYILARLGRAGEAREVLSLLDTLGRGRYVPPYARAIVQAGLGERDAVFESLDRAYAARDEHVIFLTVDPKWDAWRADPRFSALLARCDFSTPRPLILRPDFHHGARCVEGVHERYRTPSG